MQIEQSTESKWENLVLSVVVSLIVRLGGVGSSHPNPEMKHGLSPLPEATLKNPLQYYQLVRGCLLYHID